MNIKPIRTQEDYRRALREVEKLWDAKPGTSAMDRLDVLATLVDAYEEEHFPIALPDPIAAINLRMEEKALKNRDLLPVFGTTARISEVLNKKRGLSLDMIRELNQRLNIPLDVLVQKYGLRSPAEAKRPKARGRTGPRTPRKAA